MYGYNDRGANKQNLKEKTSKTSSMYERIMEKMLPSAIKLVRICHLEIVVMQMSAQEQSTSAPPNHLLTICCNYFGLYRARKCSTTKYEEEGNQQDCITSCRQGTRRGSWSDTAFVCELIRPQLLTTTLGEPESRFQIRASSKPISPENNQPSKARCVQPPLPGGGDSVCI